MNQQTEHYSTVAGIQADLQWLYNAWMNIRDDPAYTAMNPDPVIRERLDKFLERLHTTAGSDKALRLTGFTGCVFAPKQCPESGPMSCAAHI